MENTITVGSFSFSRSDLSFSWFLACFGKSPSSCHGHFQHLHLGKFDFLQFCPVLISDRKCFFTMMQSIWFWCICISSVLCNFHSLDALWLPCVLFVACEVLEFEPSVVSLQTQTSPRSSYTSSRILAFQSECPVLAFYQQEFWVRYRTQQLSHRHGWKLVNIPEWWHCHESTWNWATFYDSL